MGCMVYKVECGGYVLVFLFFIVVDEVNGFFMGFVVGELLWWRFYEIVGRICESIVDFVIYGKFCVVYCIDYDVGGIG